MAEAAVREPEKAGEVTSIVLAPQHYKVHEMTNLKSGEPVICVTFWMTPGRTDPKPLTIAMTKEDAANIVMDIAQTLEKLMAPATPGIITEGT